MARADDRLQLPAREEKEQQIGKYMYRIGVEEAEGEEFPPLAVLDNGAVQREPIAQDVVRRFPFKKRLDDELRAEGPGSERHNERRGGSAARLPPSHERLHLTAGGAHTCRKIRRLAAACKIGKRAAAS